MAHPRLAASCSSPSDLLNTDTPKAQRQDPFDEMVKKVASTRSQPQQHVLMTPPLTPASSINSVSSAGSYESEGSVNFVRHDLDENATHFLLIGQLDTTCSDEIFRVAISEALAAIKNTRVLTTPGEECDQGEVIRARNTRRVESYGEAILAFYDVRHAAQACQILTRPPQGTISKCLDQAYDSLTCRFLSKDETVTLIGTSKLTTSSLDGEIFVSCELNFARIADPDASDDSDGAELASVTFGQALRGLCHTYGDLRSFEDLGRTNGVHTFRVQYLDYRSAASAYTASQGLKFLGTQLRIYRRGHSSDAAVDEHDMLIQGPPLAQKSQEVAQGSISTPGQHSLTRERFYPQPQPPVSTPANDAPTHLISGGHVHYATPHPAAVPNGLSPTHPWYLNRHQQYPNSKLTPDPHGPRAPVAGDGHHEPGYPAAYYPYSPESFFHHHQATNISHLPPHYYPSPPPVGPPPQSPAPPVFYHPAHMVAHSSPPMPYPTSPAPSFEYETPAPQVVYPYHAPYVYDPSTMGSSPTVPYYVPVHAVSPEGEFWNARSQSEAEAAHAFYTRFSVVPSFFPVQTPSPRASPTEDAPAAPQQAATEAASGGATPPHRSPSSGLIIHKPRDPAANQTPERNQLNIAKIEEGLDTRTTVMVKNIPNKMSDKDLVTYIGKVCPRRIDFLYLRMDFKNGCNVGYAFVNFITVQDLLTFAKKRLGEKWNMFSSEKVLQMSYANYQGKEALIEKFKNSCIMDEREAWRPKIFYSDGAEQGLPQEFPAPTHLRRKERSSLNRGALYVPGVHNGGLHHHNNHQYRQMPPRKTYRDDGYYKRQDNTLDDEQFPVIEDEDEIEEGECAF